MNLAESRRISKKKKRQHHLGKGCTTNVEMFEDKLEMKIKKSKTNPYSMLTKCWFLKQSTRRLIKRQTLKDFFLRIFKDFRSQK